ncbi:MAG: precorrin-2 C(20)-methyltransferase [Alphaproteobacteria bacterium]
MSGTLYGLGIGPGDPELLTLKALRLIRSAPVLAYPATPEGESRARAIVAPHVPGGQTEIPIRVPFGADRARTEAAYDEAAETLGGHLAEGRDVAMLCLGDPFLYGTFMYLFARISGRFPVMIVPGVSSLTAAAAALKLPLAARDDVLTIVPATLGADEIAARIEDADAAAIVKIGRHFAKARRVLESLGLAGRARYVEHATMEDERVLPLAEVQDGEVPYFSMILVHKRGEAWR